MNENLHKNNIYFFKYWSKLKNAEIVQNFQKMPKVPGFSAFA